MKELEKLKSQQEKVQKEIEQLQNRQKILLNRKTDTERRARTRRLIEHGAILESIFPATAAMTGEEAKAFLLALSRLREAGNAADNRLLKEIKARITRLYNWSKEQAGKPEGKDSILLRLWQARQEMDSPDSRYGKIKDLKEQAALYSLLQGNGITTMGQLHEKISAMNKNYYDLRGKIVSAERRIKVLDEHLSMWEQYEKHKGIRRQLDKVKPGKIGQFEQKHETEIALYEAAARYLEKLKSGGEVLTPKKWRAESEKLTVQKEIHYREMRTMREQIRAVENLRKAADKLERSQQDRNRKKEDNQL